MTDPRTRMQNRLSVKKLGVGLAGLDGVNQKVPLAASSKILLVNAIKTNGLVKMTVQGDSLVGKTIKTTGMKTWGEKLNEMAKNLRETEPSYFVLFRSAKDCLVVTYVPDNAKPFFKMLYASSKESVKDAVMSFDDEMQLEEFNVAEISELSHENYEKKMSAPKPYSEAEIIRKEQEEAETAGGYGVLARIIAMQNGKASTDRDVLSGDAGAKPMALPGLAGPGGLAGIKLKPINARKIKKNPGKNVSVAKKNPAPIAKKVAPVAKVPKPVEKKPTPVEEELKEELKPVGNAIKKVVKIVKVPAKEEDDITVVISADSQEDIVEWDGPEGPFVEVEVEEEVIEATEEVEEAPKIETEVEPEKEPEDEVEPVEEPTVLDFDEEAILAPVNAKPKLPPAQVEEESFEMRAAQRPSFGVVTSDQANKPKRGRSSMFSFVSRIFRKTKPIMLNEEDIEALDDSDGMHTLEDLLELKASGNLGKLDPSKLETYLSTREFSRATKMSKEAFYSLKVKDQNQIKEKLGLL